MAPRNKFTREEMIAAGVRVVSHRGGSALTAKAIAEELGVSTQPVFTCFSTMEEARREVRCAAEKIYERYVLEGLHEPIPFYGFGTQYIRFARENPELYRLLFLTPNENGTNEAVAAMAHSQALVRGSLCRIYHITPDEADRYFRDMWLVVHALATLIVTGGCPYSDNEIGAILTGFSVSLCKAIKEISGFAAGRFDRDAVFRALVNA